VYIHIPLQKSLGLAARIPLLSNVILVQKRLFYNKKAIETLFERK
jgi:hypothetical protein